MIAGDRPLAEQKLREENDRCVAKALKAFSEVKKLGGQQLAKFFEQKMTETMQVRENAKII